MTVAVPFNRDPQLPNLGWIQNGLVRSLPNCLTSILVKLRLGVETLHVTDPTAHEQPDHLFGLRSKVRSAIRSREPFGRHNAVNCQGTESQS